MQENILKVRWSLYGFIAFFGVFCLVMTYGALIASKKSGKHISGVPLFGGFFLFIAGLVSPCKWLCLLCFLDYGFWELPYLLYLAFIKKDKHDD